MSRVHGPCVGTHVYKALSYRPQVQVQCSTYVHTVKSLRQIRSPTRKFSADNSVHIIYYVDSSVCGTCIMISNFEKNLVEVKICL